MYIKYQILRFWQLLIKIKTWGLKCIYLSCMKYKFYLCIYDISETIFLISIFRRVSCILKKKIFISILRIIPPFLLPEWPYSVDFTSTLMRIQYLMWSQWDPENHLRHREISPPRIDRVWVWQTNCLDHRCLVSVLNNCSPRVCQVVFEIDYPVDLEVLILIYTNPGKFKARQCVLLIKVKGQVNTIDSNRRKSPEKNDVWNISNLDIGFQPKNINKKFA